MTQTGYNRKFKEPRRMKSKTKSNDFSCNSSYYNRQWSCSWNTIRNRTKSATQHEQILCVHQNSQIKTREQVQHHCFQSLCLYQHCIIYAVLVLVIRVNTVLHEYFCNCTSIFIDLQDCHTRVEIHSAAKGHYTRKAVSKQLHKTAGNVATSY